VKNLFLFLFLLSFSLQAQWIAVTSGLAGDIWGVDWVDENTAWIVDANGAVARSTDGGMTFTAAGSVGAAAYSIAGLSATTAVVVTGPASGNGAIFRTTNGGTNWTQVYTATGAWFNSVDNLSSTLLWAQSDPTDGSFHIVKSTDAGATWALASNRPAAPATNVFGANSSYYSIGNTLWFGTGGASGATLANRVYRSANGVDGPWTFATANNQFTGSLAFNSATGIGLVGYWQATNSLGRSTDGGISFGATTPSIGLTRGLEFLPGTNIGWAATSTGLWRTQDGGVNWAAETLPLGFSSSVMPKVFVVNANSYKVLVGGNGGQLLRYFMVVPVELTSFTAAVSGKTVNLNWVTASETNNQGFEVQRKVGEEGEFAVVGFKSGMGTTTERAEYVFADDISGLNAEKIYYRLKQIDFGGQYEYSDEIEVSTVFAADAYAIHQNYPNPFNPSTAITFDLPADNVVTIAVYNALGQQVTELYNGFTAAGRHTVNFDATGLTSGIYYAVMKTADNAFRQSIKMSLMK